jgi:hypothetical protein
MAPLAHDSPSTKTTTSETPKPSSSTPPLPGDKRFFVGYTMATFLGVLLAITTLHLFHPPSSSSHALMPYPSFMNSYCSKYSGAHPGARNDSVINISTGAPHSDRLDALELKLEELRLALKALGMESLSMSNRLDSELAGTGRILEDIAERLHRVENHVFVSEDLT